MPKSKSTVKSNNPHKSFYTLQESVAFANNPDIKIVYFTEKGIDLYAALPEYADIEYATRNGYSWDQVIHNPPSCIKKQHTKQICIVKTTEAELAARQLATPPQEPAAHVDHTTQLLEKIDALPLHEWSMDRIVDIIVEYMTHNNIKNMDFADAICRFVGNRGIISTNNPSSSASTTTDVSILTPPKLPASPVSDISESETIGYDGIDTKLPGSISAWLVTSFDSVCTSIQHLTLSILPIPSDDSWILAD